MMGDVVIFILEVPFRLLEYVYINVSHVFVVLFKGSMMLGKRKLVMQLFLSLYIIYASFQHVRVFKQMDWHCKFLT